MNYRLSRIAQVWLLAACAGCSVNSPSDPVAVLRQEWTSCIETLHSDPDVSERCHKRLATVLSGWPSRDWRTHVFDALAVWSKGIDVADPVDPADSEFVFMTALQVEVARYLIDSSDVDGMTELFKATYVPEINPAVPIEFELANQGYQQGDPVRMLMPIVRASQGSSIERVRSEWLGCLRTAFGNQVVIDAQHPAESLLRIENWLRSRSMELQPDPEYLYRYARRESEVQSLDLLIKKP